MNPVCIKTLSESVNQLLGMNVTQVVKEQLQVYTASVFVVTESTSNTRVNFNDNLLALKLLAIKTLHYQSQSQNITLIISSQAASLQFQARGPAAFAYCQKFGRLTENAESFWRF
jgi:hypothetical protein